MDPLIAQTTKSFADWLVEPWVRIVIILGTAVLVTLASRLVVNRFRKKLEGTASITQELNLQRATTLTGALSTALIVVIWVLAILMALGQLETNIAPLLASAGVVGVALGFGAQTIVKDTLSGFFILLENQFGVGDNVDIQTPSNRVAGRVESPDPPGHLAPSVRRNAPFRAQREHPRRQQPVEGVGARDHRCPHRLRRGRGASAQRAGGAVRGARRAIGPCPNGYTRRRPCSASSGWAMTRS